MNKVRNISYMALSLLMGAAVTSCRDVNDWDTDGSAPRLFSVNGSKITVEAEDTYAQVTFTGVPDVSYYIIEVSQDSLYDDIQQGGTASSIVFGTDKSITKSPVTLTDLAGDSKYFLRMKAVSETVAESKWSYLIKSNTVSTFKTKAEQIFNESVASDRDEDRIRLSWDASKTVTNILVLDGNGDEIQNITLDDAAKAAGEFTVTGLTPSTTYTFVIKNGEAIRGTLRVATTAAMPKANYKYLLSEEVTVISQELLDEIAENAKAVSEDPNNYSVTIGIPAGTTIDLHGEAEDGSATSVKIPEGMSVTFFGLAGGAAPVLNLSKAVDIRGSHAYISFNNVEIKDGGCQYVINQSEGCTVGELSFVEVTLTDMARSWVRLQGSSAKTIETIAIDNCMVKNQGSGNYALLYFNNAAYNVGKVSIKNSTFDTMMHSFIDCRNAVVGSIDISNSTFYNIIGAGRYFVDAQNVNVPVVLTNVILAKVNNETAKGVRDATVEAVNSLMTSDFVLASNKFSTDITYEGTAADLFKDPENGDFTIKDASVSAGDPRWLVTEE